MSNIFKHEHRVSYSECTLGDHVYYARYLDILERARGEFFRAIGIPFLILQNEGIIFPVVECNMRYKAPARYDDVLRVEIWVSELERIRARFEYKIYKEPSRLVVEGSTFHVCTGVNEKPRPWPEKLAAALQPYLHQAGQPE